MPNRKVVKWQKLIEKPGLNSQSKLCEVHFDESHIVRGFVVGNQFNPMPRIRLITKDVVPTKHLTGNCITV